MYNLPSAAFEINGAWLANVGIACDLLAWSKSVTQGPDRMRWLGRFS